MLNALKLNFIIGKVAFTPALYSFFFSSSWIFVCVSRYRCWDGQMCVDELVQVHT